MTALRIQLRRTKGWRIPENTVKCDRTTKWGNPWKAGLKGPSGRVIVSARHAAQVYGGHAPDNAALVADAQRLLAGHNLACWCKLCDLHREGKPLNETCPFCEPCHVDTLGTIANGS